MSASIVNFIDKGLLQSQTFTANGTFNVPKGVTEVFVEGSGAGQGGYPGVGSAPGGRGGNGAYGALVPVSVASEAAISVIIGTGGVGTGAPGGNSSFGALVFRGAGDVTIGKSGFLGGDGGAASAAFSSIGRGSLNYSGGNSAAGDLNPSSSGPGGGGAAGYWGDGGDGGASASGGSNASLSGGGGGSGTPTASSGGTGGDGQIRVYWISPT